MLKFKLEVFNDDVKISLAEMPGFSLFLENT